MNWLERPHSGRRFDILRLADISLASLASVIMLLVAVVVAILVWCCFGSPVLFRQQRAGLHGKEFSILKFRTMRVGAYPEEPDSERTSRLGSILRSTSLDELPQLVNILRGEMAVIGPRPTLLDQVERYDARQWGRLAVRPGLTGWAQIHGRNSLSWPQRIELDLWYIEHRSWKVDLRILLATVRYVMRPRGVVGPGGVNPGFPAASESAGGESAVEQ